MCCTVQVQLPSAWPPLTSPFSETKIMLLHDNTCSSLHDTTTFFLRNCSRQSTAHGLTEHLPACISSSELMGKRRLQLKAAAAATSAASLHKKTSAISKDAPLHRGRKKRLEAKRRLEKKKDFIKTEVEKLEKESEEKRIQQGKGAKKNYIGPALAVLGRIAEEIPDKEKEYERGDYRNRSVTSHKQRTKIVQEEGEQVRRVQQHEAFKSNPIEALRQHLMNTVSSDPSEIPPPLKEGSAGAPKERKGGDGKGKKGSKDGDKSVLHVPDKEALEKLREEAKERVARKREEKASYAAAAQKLRKRKTSGKIEKQTLSGLVSRSKRGRIGVKRAKI